MINDPRGKLISEINVKYFGLIPVPQFVLVSDGNVTYVQDGIVPTWSFRLPTDMTDYLPGFYFENPSLYYAPGLC
jgi:hypothetical protein